MIYLYHNDSDSTAAAAADSDADADDYMNHTKQYNKIDDKELYTMASSSSSSLSYHNHE